MVDDGDETVRVDLREEPLWLLFQVNVNLLVWDVLGRHYQPHSLENQVEQRISQREERWESVEGRFRTAVRRVL